MAQDHWLHGFNDNALARAAFTVAVVEKSLLGAS